MAIAFACPSCGASYKVGDDHAGKTTKCRTCGTRMVVPDAEAPLAPAYAAPQPVAPVSSSPASGQLKPCPFCGEDVLAVAKKCKHCGETLDIALRSAEEARRVADHSSRGGSGAASAAASTTVIVQDGGRGFPHFLHLILTIFTCGAWFPIWILHYVFSSR